MEKLKLFKVVIEFNEDLDKEEVQEIISKYFYEEDIVSEKENKIIVLLSTPEDEGAYEIENEMFYILNGESLGTYSCELFNSDK